MTEVQAQTSDLEVTQDGSGIEWSEPPTARRGKAAADQQYIAIADALKARPGQWAKIIDGSKDTSVVTKIKKGTLAAFEPEGAFDATGRRSEDGYITVWARFNVAE